MVHRKRFNLREFLRLPTVKTAVNRKPRLLFLVNDPAFFLSHRLVIATAARDAGFSVFVATPPGPGMDDIKSLGFTFIPVHLERWGMNPMKEARSLFHLYRVYRKVRPDVVHHVTIKPVLYGSFVAKLARVPAVVNAISGLGYVFISKGLLASVRRSLVQTVYRFVLRHPNSKVLFQNPDDRDFFISNRMVKNDAYVMVKGSGVDTSRFVPCQVHNDRPVVLMVARLLKDKGLYEFVEAARLLRRKGVLARFIVAGSPATGNPAGVSAEQLAVWKEEGSVEFIGYQQEMLPVYQKSDIVCLPSYREGLPKALIEGASVGKPLVATDVPGCREVVRDGINGFLVSLGDSVGLSKALECLIEDTELRTRMGIVSRQMALTEGFGEEYVVAATLAVYRTLLKNIGIEIPDTASLPETGEFFLH